MTKNDLLSDIKHYRNNPNEAKAMNLIFYMHNKIEYLYRFASNLEKDKDLKKIGQVLKKALEK